MVFDGKPISEIGVDELKQVVSNNLSENQNLDFKLEPYSNNYADRKEMLADICAMANSGGGYILIGVEEDSNECAQRFLNVEDARTVSTAMRNSCLDNIAMRIYDLMIEPYTIEPGTDIVMVRVPDSGARPHMVTLHNRTHFYRRHYTDKREMSVDEIGASFLTSPAYGRSVDFTESERLEGDGEAQSVKPFLQYTKLYTNQPVKKFLEKLFTTSITAKQIVVVSPFIGSMEGEIFELAMLAKKADKEKIPLYVITREPKDDYHKKGVEILKECKQAEIRFNKTIHAKLYVCITEKESDSFALFGSGNLTSAGVSYNLELGMMIFSRGPGASIIRTLFKWGASELRTLESSILIKKRGK